MALNADGSREWQTAVTAMTKTLSQRPHRKSRVKSAGDSRKKSMPRARATMTLRWTILSLHMSSSPQSRVKATKIMARKQKRSVLSRGKSQQICKVSQMRVLPSPQKKKRNKRL